MLRPALLCITLVAGLADSAAAMPAGFGAGETAEVVAASADDTLRLADGRELGLAAIETPRAVPPQGGAPDPKLAALAEAARAALDEIARGRTATLYQVQRRAPDGRLVAEVEVGQRWLQAELLARGLARVHTTPETAAGAAELLRIEADARRARLGIWTHPAFRVRNIDHAGRWIDSFQIVEGRLAAATPDSGGRVLTFIEEASDVFTVVVPAAAVPRFRAAGIDFDQIVGWRSLRVRGVIRWRDGPYLELDHPAQLETGG